MTNPATIIDTPTISSSPSKPELPANPTSTIHKNISDKWETGTIYLDIKEL